MVKDDNFQTITEILVRRGLATSTKDAEDMVENEEVSTPQSGGIVIDPKARYRFNEPIVLVDEDENPKPSSGKRGRISRREFARRADFAARLVTFGPSKKTADRPAAKSGYPTRTCEEEERVAGFHPASQKILQEDLMELCVLRRLSRENGKKLKAKEEFLLAALRRGWPIESGVHSIELGECLKFDGEEVD